MRYTLRVYVKDRLEETLTSADAEVPLARFRAIVAEWPNDWRHVRWSASVVAEPTETFPLLVRDRSFPIASYQNPAAA